MLEEQNNIYEFYSGEMLHSLKKGEFGNTTGYSLCSLFVGSEPMTCLLLWIATVSTTCLQASGLRKFCLVDWGKYPFQQEYFLNFKHLWLVRLTTKRRLPT